MKKIRPLLQYGIIGTGALGAYYGALLHHAHCSVNFLVRSDAKAVRQNGLRISSNRGDLSIAKPNFFESPQDFPVCDVLCICAKATANRELRKWVGSKIASGGVLLVLQNGLGAEEDFRKVVRPNVAILGGLCFLCAYREAPGVFRHVDYGAVRLAAAIPNPPSANHLLEQVAADFHRAGIETTISPHLEAARWSKLVWNIPFNGLSVVLGTDTRSLVENAAGLALVRKLMQETAALAAARGHAIPPEFIEKMISDTRRMTPYLPSMRLDYDSGRPMEIAAIYERPLQWGAQANCTAPTIEALALQLHYMEENRNQQGGVP